MIAEVPTPDWDVLQTADTLDQHTDDFMVAPRPYNVSGDAESTLVNMTASYQMDLTNTGEGPQRSTLPFEVGWRNT